MEITRPGWAFQPTPKGAPCSSSFATEKGTAFSESLFTRFRVQGARGTRVEGAGEGKAGPRADVPRACGQCGRWRGGAGARGHRGPHFPGTPPPRGLRPRPARPAPAPGPRPRPRPRRGLTCAWVAATPARCSPRGWLGLRRSAGRPPARGKCGAQTGADCLPSPRLPRKRQGGPARGPSLAGALGLQGPPAAGRPLAPPGSRASPVLLAAQPTGPGKPQSPQPRRNLQKSPCSRVPQNAPGQPEASALFCVGEKDRNPCSIHFIFLTPCKASRCTFFFFLQLRKVEGRLGGSVG